MTFELVEDLAKEGVEYAELRFAPQFSIKDGLTQDEVVEAAIRGAERGMKMYPQIRVGLILCCMRGADNEELNMQTVETAKKYLGDVSARWTSQARKACSRLRISPRYSRRPVSTVFR